MAVCIHESVRSLKAREKRMADRKYLLSFHPNKCPHTDLNEIYKPETLFLQALED